MIPKQKPGTSWEVMREAGVKMTSDECRAIVAHLVEERPNYKSIYVWVRQKDGRDAVTTFVSVPKPD